VQVVQHAASSIVLFNTFTKSDIYVSGPKAATGVSGAWVPIHRLEALKHRTWVIKPASCSDQHRPGRVSLKDV
jgi:hypothetical protein